ncbi:MAG TPA: rhomboid family intramembrane serine protease [Solirubrobacterales bacterium]|jgi:membrane associated rhomboid family serine protease/DNA-directed RNA polymerase subunit RPC12/RpoP
MSETELSVICKTCGSEVSPFITECPYCGARLRKRAPKLERRDGTLEAKSRRRSGTRRFGMRLRRGRASARVVRPYATLVAIFASAALLLIQRATGSSIATLGGLVTPVDGEWWRFFTAPFVYGDIGYLFVISIGLVIFSIDLERRLGTVATAVLLIASGSLGMLAASGIGSPGNDFAVIAGGNGMALGALAAWFAIRRSEARRAVDRDYDAIAVCVAAAVLLALPIFEATADPVAGLVGGLVGGLAGFAASTFRAPE